jgi:CDP-4-dehydro-6-deoxyglucose reductase
MATEWTEAWRSVELTGNREVGRGCRLLTLRVPDQLPFPFEPGHVLSLRHGGHRHPYTVSQADPAARELGLLFRVIPGGRLTPQLQAAAPGQRMEINGLHHEPVRALIAPAARAVVGLATGSGIGPLWGFALAALAAGFDRPISLFAGYREAADICLASELDALQAAYPGFRWLPTLTGPDAGWKGLQGRVGDSAPALIPDPRSRHFHLVGNGAMLAELKAALALVGVPAEQVTSEVFFNYNAKATEEVAQAIAGRFPPLGA